jgi:hypothetical protein
MACAVVCRWMNFCPASVAFSFSALAAENLDVIAKHVVVLDLQGADARFGTQPCFKVDDHKSRIVTQSA